MVASSVGRWGAGTLAVVLLCEGALGLSAAVGGPTQDAPGEIAVAVANGRDYLLSCQEEDGSFTMNQFGRPFGNRGVTGMAVLALLGSTDDRHVGAAIDALDYLVGNPNVSHMYAHAYATHALAAGSVLWPDDFREPLSAAVRVVVESQNENGGWGYGPTPEPGRTETCCAALMLLALHEARRAGVEVPDPTIDGAIAFVEGQFNETARIYNNETTPSPTLGATALAVAALQVWNRTDTEAFQAGEEALQALEMNTLTANPKGTPFPGYMRGLFQFEIAAVARARSLTLAPGPFARWHGRLVESLLQGDASKGAGQREDGSWEGWFGETYGTALTLLTLTTEKPGGSDSDDGP